MKSESPERPVLDLPKPSTGSRSSSRGPALALTLLALALLAPTSNAGDPTGANYPHKFDFGQGRSFVDVAPYAPGDVAKYVFASTLGHPRIQRYNGIGQTNWLQLETSTPPLPPTWRSIGKLGLAANDRPGSSTFGRVLVTDIVTNGIISGGVLWQYDTDLVSLWGSALFLDALFTIPLPRPFGVALDEAGDVYVVDEVTKLVYRYDHADVAAILPGLAPKQSYGDGLQFPTGVSVDHNGRVHVNYLNGDYTVFEPSGSIAATTIIAGTWVRGVCAVQPCADGFTTKLDGSYNIDRVDWDWVPLMSGTVDLTVKLGVPMRPINLEYQKTNVMVGGQGLWPGWKQQACRERLYLAGPMTLAAFGQDYLSVSLPAGKRAWYRFEEEHVWSTGTALPVADYLGTNVATAGTVAPRNVEGMVRSAFDTRSGTAYAEAPDSADLRFGNGSMTIEGWLRSEQRVGVATLLDKRSGIGAGYSVYLFNGRIGFQVNDGVWQNFAGASLVADGRWRHFAVVLDRDSDELRVYVDGQLDTSIASTVFGSTDSTAPLQLGRNNPLAGGTPLHGAIDEITLYDEPLTAAQIAGIAGARSAGKHLWYFGPPF